MKKLLGVVASLAFAFAVAAPAAVPGATMAQLDQRVAEIDAALSQILSDALNGRIREDQKADVTQLQKSLEAEKSLLLQRKELLRRLDPQGTLAYAPAPAVPAAAPAPAIPVPAAATAGTPKGPLTLMPLTRVKPNIPDELCWHRASGWVDLDFAVMNDGRVMDVKVTNSEPRGAFDAAAMQAVAARTYPPQAAPVKLHERLPMSFADCRSDQLRARPVAVSAQSQEDCPTLAAQAKTSGDLIDSAESGRAVLAGLADGAQAYSAPSAHCFVNGRKFRSGNRLTAHVEYQGYSLVTAQNGTGEAWVRSNELKDTTP